MVKVFGGRGPLNTFTRLRGPATLVALSLVPVVIYLLSAPGPRFSDEYSTLTSLGTMLGLAGISCFALNVFLGARLWFVDAFFGGLDRMYETHRRNGEIAFLLLLGHALLMVWSRGTVSIDAATNLLTGGEGWRVVYGVVALTIMTVGIFLTLFVHLNHEVFVYVQRAFGFMFLLGALHAFSSPGAKSQSTALTVYLAVLTVGAIGGFAYRSLFDDVLVRRRNYRVTNAKRLDETITEIEMAPQEDPLRHEAGQFMYVTFESRELRELFHPITVETEGRSALLTLHPGEISQQFHPFSITAPENSDHLSIVVKAVGDYTSAMRALERGAVARVEGPYGRFTLRSAHGRSHIWVAGGIGITPFLSMARSLPAEGYEVDLYYATKRRAQAHFVPELEEISNRVGGFRIFQVVEETDGLVTAKKVAERSGGLAGKEIFLCGPPAMIESLRTQFMDAGVSKRRIHFERFGFVR